MCRRFAFRFLLIVCFACIHAVAANAQDLTIPQNEFSIYVPDSITIGKGTAKDIEVWVLRSRTFRQKNIRLSTDSPLPQGVVIKFERNQGYFEYSRATISVNPATQPGEYKIIVSGTTLNKTKGSIVTLIIPDDEGFSPTTRSSNRPKQH